MSKPYLVYVGSTPLSKHETFALALEQLRKKEFRGCHLRNAERSDVDDNGLTEDERAQLEAV